MQMHQEARRRRMHMDRVCEARRRMALAQSQNNGQAPRMLAESSAYNGAADSQIWADQQSPYEAMKQLDHRESMGKVPFLRPLQHNQKANPSPPINVCPPVFQDIKRDHIYKTLHPHSDC